MKKHVLRAPGTDRYQIEIPTSYNDLTDLPVIPPEYVPPDVLSVIYHTLDGADWEGSETLTVNFERGEYDPNSYVTTGASWVFTVPAGNLGIYLLTSFLQIDFDGANVECNIALICRVNGAEVARSTLAGTHAAGGSQTIDLTLVRYLAAGDTVDFQLANNNVDNTTITTPADITKNGVSITRLR